MLGLSYAHAQLYHGVLSCAVGEGDLWLTIAASSTHLGGQLMGGLRRDNRHSTMGRSRRCAGALPPRK